ncbi:MULTISPECIES: ComF family protein [unclassified Paenibacillus]|uniref:ComF family protein n=1 Tax=unclassified Paenibacillus TaxID=185978 RepID=UPI002406B847|nr:MULTISPECIES: ComF family protein [unclassified Paenibacillus]MDF9840131.1 competence protein ComFC [Paenibacillus sp. PastF-2]MDF9846713.1 competence protein ComFC [Paenibacillus sp. PastM-2]MDF9852938.1 competence protein ComFC [Paenibacillus sp. PastF-1]MDH6478557.1 competence protein ComFC [Paenibacillus sp. PastH-2]MDH6505945.1 competence protein ComFC [Paenibacillus sp. PastM-3]
MNNLSDWITGIRSLLAPAIIRCLICSSNGRPSAGLPGICTGCEAGIPWIRQPRCQTCGRHTGCPDCSRSGQSAPILYNRSAVAYTQVMRELLGRYKYRGHERLAPLLGLMLDRAYIQLKVYIDHRQNLTLVQSQRLPVHSILRKKKVNPANLWHADLLVPVPVSDSRLMERGFNQAERLADVLSGLKGIPQLPLLVRTHHTGKQSFKSRAERIADMKHAFAANSDNSVRAQISSWLSQVQDPGRPLQILIIDDIYTTGSTIRACAEAVQLICASHRRDAEIYSLTWARS